MIEELINWFIDELIDCRPNHRISCREVINEIDSKIIPVSFRKIIIRCKNKHRDTDPFTSVCSNESRVCLQILWRLKVSLIFDQNVSNILKISSSWIIFSNITRTYISESKTGITVEIRVNFLINVMHLNSTWRVHIELAVKRNLRV